MWGDSYKEEDVRQEEEEEDTQKATTLAVEIPKLTSLRYLKLNMDGFTADGCKHVFAVVGKIPTLREVTLYSKENNWRIRGDSDPLHPCQYGPRIKKPKKRWVATTTTE